MVNRDLEQKQIELAPCRLNARRASGLPFSQLPSRGDPSASLVSIRRQMGKVWGYPEGYREDIDWLRAIAVLAVVAFPF